MLQKVVGIGASAGGLEALQALISQLPAELPGTAIVIAQHLSPDYKSMLVELLGRKTAIPVEHIQDGTPLNENRIYIAPPSDDLVVKDETLFFQAPAATGPHPSVDVLLGSLAKTFGPGACGIILSGTGKDGALGLTAVKHAGGLAIVQQPATAKYDGMPQAAIQAGPVDYVLPPEHIGQRLPVLLQRHPAGAAAAEDEPAKLAATFPQIFQLLEQRIGINFADYKPSTLSRRLHSRIREHRLRSEEEYLNFIRKQPEELDRLFAALLIGVTAFFRDPDIFTSLQKVLSDIIANKQDGGTVRIWVPGCATGEEAYTIAILLCELLGKSRRNVILQIFATDIDMKALHQARSGVYPAISVQKVPAPYLAKYFKKVSSDNYEVHKDIRKLVLFSRHDVTANPPFLRLDLVSCRNLLIYFNNELQKKVLPLFHYALNPDGYLLLGRSENIGKFQNLFAVVDQAHKIFRRKAVDSKRVKFPLLRPQRTQTQPATRIEANREAMTVADMVKETLFHDYGAPFVVINDTLEIVEINGDVAPYLQLKPGSASLNLVKLILAPLQIELRAVVGKAVASQKPASSSLRKIIVSGQPHWLRMTVKPLLHSLPADPLFLIVFEDIAVDQMNLQSSPAALPDQAADSDRTIELEQELDSTKEHMNSLLEELETSNEELQALNEEMQASNEELQASNEELETSNEELQATNEELENAYSELREANAHIEEQKQQLATAAENLSMLLNNTLTGFILIDRDFHILATNRIASTVYRELYGVQPQEGSSFIKLLPAPQFSAFHDKFKQALSGKQVVTETEYAGKDGITRYFDVNYTPVAKSSREREARMVAISFVDITRRKRAELELAATNHSLAEEKQFMQTLTESLPSLVWTTDASGSFLYGNSYFLNYVGKPLEDIQAASWPAIIHPNDLESTVRLWDSVLMTGQKFSIEHRIRHNSGQYRWHLSVAETVRENDGTVRLWAGSSTEIETLKKRQEMDRRVTQLKQQRNELLQVNQLKDQFINLASHQLRTPATAVKQYLGIVLSEMAGPIAPNQRQHLQTAFDSNERQLTIIDDLLKTARLDVNDFKLKKDRCDIGKLVRDIIESMQPMLDLKQQQAVLRCPRPVKALIDQQEVKLALTNLLENASKYSYPGTTIEVNVHKDSGQAQIEVKDEGVGISEQDQKRIFDKFTRVDNELSFTVTGTGLGLYWVKRIAKMHNGDVRVSSRLREGSTFTMELPL